jgi:hypothetical protein
MTDDIIFEKPDFKMSLRDVYAGINFEAESAGS